MIGSPRGGSRTLFESPAPPGRGLTARARFPVWPLWTPCALDSDPALTGDGTEDQSAHRVNVAARDGRAGVPDDPEVVLSVVGEQLASVVGVSEHSAALDAHEDDLAGLAQLAQVVRVVAASSVAHSTNRANIQGWSLLVSVGPCSSSVLRRRCGE